VEFLEPESAMTIPDRFYPLLTLLETMLNELEAQYRYIDKRFEDASWVGCRLAELLPLSLDQKQVCLEVSDPVQRLEILTRLVEALKQ
jgi:Lon protease-like protein